MESVSEEGPRKDAVPEEGAVCSRAAEASTGRKRGSESKS